MGKLDVGRLDGRSNEAAWSTLQYKVGLRMPDT